MFSSCFLKVDESNVQMQECYKCGTAVPLLSLRSHLTTCETPIAADESDS